MASSLISIPEYFTRFIDRSIDLTKIPKICCPFHEEDTPSFSYSSEKGLWRCFGACKVGGDVIALHQKNYRLRSRREAEDSLYKLLGLRTEGFRRQVERVKLAVDVLVACIIAVALIVCTQLSRTIMLTMDKERAASADVLEYRVARMYDNEECYPQDIVSLVLEYQGSPAVNVTTRRGSTMSWSSSSYHTELTSASISAVLNQASTYLCTLTYDANGSLSSYNFREV